MSIKNYKLQNEINTFLCYSQSSESEDSEMLFKNLPELIVPELAAKLLNKSVKTLYDWRYRGKMRKKKIPPNLFTKIGGGLYLRKKEFISWIENVDRSFS